MQISAEAKSGASQALFEAVWTCGGCGKQKKLGFDGIVDYWHRNPLKRLVWHLKKLFRSSEYVREGCDCRK